MIPASDGAENTFKFVIILTAISFAITCAVYGITCAAVVFGNPSILVITYLLQTFQSLFFICLLVLGTRTRIYVGKEYRISSQCCGKYEDFCCIFFCNCCVVSQMARHTADCHSQPATCCSKTGLRRNVNYLDNYSHITQSDGERLV